MGTSQFLKKNNLVIDKFKIFNWVGYNIYHEAVRMFHGSDATVKIAVAPRRTTKSYSAAHDVLDIILMPNTRVWIVGPTYTLAEKEFRYIYDIMVVKAKMWPIPLPKPKSAKFTSNASCYLKFPWGSIVETKSAERPASLLGEEVDAVIYSEAAQMPGKIRTVYVQPTLVTRKGKEIIPTTPSMDAQWLYDLWLSGIEGHEDIKCFSWNRRANPKYDESEFEKAKRMFGENSPEFREQYLGEWVFFGGRVYNTFQKDVHVIEPFEIPEHFKRIRAIDFGARDPFVCLWAAIGTSGEIYFYREYYCEEGKSINEHARNIKEYSSDEYIIKTVCDPSARQAIIDLTRYGIAGIPANNDRLAGRMRVMEYLAETPGGVPPMKQPMREERELNPRMYVFSNMKKTIQEFQFYRWKEAVNRERDSERTEGPDHAMDALRYLIMERPSPNQFQLKVVQGSFSYYKNKIRNRNISKNIN